MTEGTDFFDGVGGGAGAPTGKLKDVGDFVHGEIVEFFKRDYIPFGHDKPELDDSGQPKQQLVIIVQTENRSWQNVVKVPKVDPSDPNSPTKDPSEDDGKRAVYVPARKNIQFAIARAMQSAGAKKFEVGATLGVKISNLKDTGKGNPLKEHEATYTPPTQGGDFFGGEQAQPAQSAPAAQPAAAPAQQAPQQDPWATSSAPQASAPPF